jgi:phosphatidylglycerophosphatase A
MLLHKTIASVFGIGFIRGGGTIAAALYCIIWWLLPAALQHTWWQAVIVLIICCMGTWSANKVDSQWGKDSSRVVIDEVSGMAIALFYMPHHWQYVTVALALFRFFDIVKPLGVQQMEKLPLGYGVMADDILAGLYAFIILKMVVLLQLLPV